LAIAGQSPRMVRGAASSALLGDVLELLAEAARSAEDVLPGMLPEALAGTSLGDRVIVISTQPIDLSNVLRFPATADQNERRTVLRDAICLDVSRPSFAQIFDWSETEQPKREVARWQP
jgi:hypothetical protein